MVSLREFWGNIRRRNYGTQQPMINDSEIDFIGPSEYSSIRDFLSAISEPVKLRRERIEEYELMASDTIVSSAISMIAEDATQQDSDDEKVVWVESSSESFDRKINDWLLNVVDINSIISDIAEQVVSKGEAFLRTYAFEMSDSTKTQTLEKIGSVIPSVFEPVEDISVVVALERKGKVVGFYYNPPEGVEVPGIYTSMSSYFNFNKKHLMMRKICITRVNEEGDSVEEVYRVASGKAVIHSLRAFRSLYTVESSLMGARLSRSPFRVQG